MTLIKHIQSEVDMDTYDHLRHLSRLKNTPLKETIREAVVEYIERHEKDMMNDTLFGLVGSFSTKEGNWSERDDWRD
ncbi:MAG: hypothetical protein MIO93_02665 [ANME-2 cluster archaeon]|nr:hypothetical protein [ANME-2 cluster archaeon]